MLPIDLNRAKKILVVGENAIKMMTVGGGSSSLKVQREISPLDGIKQRVAGKAEVVYARGYVGDASGEYNLSLIHISCRKAERGASWVPTTYTKANIFVTTNTH